MPVVPVPSGHVATIVTYLEMRTPPQTQSLPNGALRLVRWSTPERTRYRALFTQVGAPWLWFSRLVMSDAALAAIIDDPAVEIYAVVDGAGADIGLLELDFRERGMCEIGYLGLVPAWIGQKHGGWLMANALSLAWRLTVDRVWLHTCTLDHPAALRLYLAQGFVPVRRAVESFADPRLSGHLPRDTAPNIPIL